MSIYLMYWFEVSIQFMLNIQYSTHHISLSADRESDMTTAYGSDSIGTDRGGAGIHPSHYAAF